MTKRYDRDIIQVKGIYTPRFTAEIRQSIKKNRYKRSYCDKINDIEILIRTIKYPA